MVRRTVTVTALGVAAAAMLLISLALSMRTPVTAASTSPAEKIDLKVLYAGNPKSDREKDFVGFLDKHFAVVSKTDLKDFEESVTEGFDVTIIDYDGDGFKAPRPQISEDYSGAIVTVGVAGGLTCSNWRLKTGYL